MPLVEAKDNADQIDIEMGVDALKVHSS